MLCGLAFFPYAQIYISVTMTYCWIALFMLIQEAGCFVIHDVHRSLCAEDTETRGPVMLRECSQDSELQQWIWWNRGMLKNVGTSRCLSADPLRTGPCQGPQGGAHGSLWECERGKLISVSGSLELSIHGKQLVLSRYRQTKHSGWRSLDFRDICPEKLKKRASGEPGNLEVPKGRGAKRDSDTETAALTEEQRNFLVWFYRTEDSTPWKLAMLALSFICLLVGFLLLGMGSMASRNRKKIGKYKVAASVAQRHECKELQAIADFRGQGKPEANSCGCMTLETAETPTHSSKSPMNGAVEGFNPGEILVTWRDDTTSTLYPDPVLQAEDPQDERVEEEGEEVKSMKSAD